MTDSFTFALRIHIIFSPLVQPVVDTTKMESTMFLLKIVERIIFSGLKPRQGLGSLEGIKEVAVGEFPANSLISYAGHLMKHLVLYPAYDITEFMRKKVFDSSKHNFELPTPDAVYLYGSLIEFSYSDESKLSVLVKKLTLGRSDDTLEEVSLGLLNKPFANALGDIYYGTIPKGAYPRFFRTSRMTLILFESEEELAKNIEALKQHYELVAVPDTKPSIWLGSIKTLWTLGGLHSFSGLNLFVDPVITIQPSKTRNSNSVHYDFMYTLLHGFPSLAELYNIHLLLLDTAGSLRLSLPFVRITPSVLNPHALLKSWKKFKIVRDSADVMHRIISSILEPGTMEEYSVSSLTGFPTYEYIYSLIEFAPQLLETIQAWNKRRATFGAASDAKLDAAGISAVMWKEMFELIKGAKQITTELYEDCTQALDKSNSMFQLAIGIWALIFTVTIFLIDISLNSIQH